MGLDPREWIVVNVAVKKSQIKRELGRALTDIEELALAEAAKHAVWAQLASFKPVSIEEQIERG